MKKHLLLAAALLFAAGTTTFFSCSHEHGEETHTHGDAEQNDDTGAEEQVMDEADEVADELSSTLYQCPMDCSNGEAFWEAGQCTVCGMDLDVIKEAN